MHFSRLPRLVTLRLHLDENNQGSWTSPAWGGFPSLKRLLLNSSILMDRGLIAATLFLQTLSSLRLTSLEITAAPPAHVEDFGRLMFAMSHFQHLQDCTVDFYTLSDWHSMVIDGNTLSPLYQISGMRKFGLGYVLIIFQREAVRDLAAAWEHLQELQLYPHMTNRYQLHLEDLPFFSQSCHTLKTLVVELFPVGYNWVCDASIHSSSCPLSCLHIGKSEISRRAEAEVAAYLAEIFPYAVIEHSFPPPPRGWTISESCADEFEFEATGTIARIDALKKTLIRGAVRAKAREEDDDDAPVSL
ncbi:uncharacterized protein PHACADRAFT_211469 [Phanerochaete carnosa HHB-10118-sp]|uniref:Uncharacterized protein n=1 Tax=Phanerochaete carnosa (strain HHB-10118-sp) TaxID=650164 RepID=K5W4H3_PHACS|nr:uncharacterized protein PHACADRAFT_211469 [Phanerochaete carnosa HHB-10118-sp]EKM53829.1 hypothetical protein PHACADRAFT_211469 [Phanerochaete carnosa HHB-10118-sp]